MLDVVDELLKTWADRLKRTDDNLIALEGDPTYQRLHDQRSALTGVTRERTLPALASVGDLFESRERLADVVTKAKRIRESISSITFWDKDEKVREILHLLSGPSIELGTETMPLAKRKLLESSEKELVMTPEELLTSMVAAYEIARDSMTAVGAAWLAVDPALAGIEEQVKGLRGASAALGRELVEIESLEAEIASLRQMSATDPLGASESLGGRLVPRIKAAQEAVESERKRRDRVDALLREARARCVELRRVHDEARAALTRASREIEGALRTTPPGLSEGLVEGIAEWLGKLEGIVAAGRLTGAEVGLTRFLESARREQAVDETARDEARKLLVQRDELVGRLGARRAHASALAAKGIVAGEKVERLADVAAKLLADKPTELDRAKGAVAAYEAAIVALAKR